MLPEGDNFVVIVYPFGQTGDVSFDISYRFDPSCSRYSSNNPGRHFWGRWETVPVEQWSTSYRGPLSGEIISCFGFENPIAAKNFRDFGRKLLEQKRVNLGLPRPIGQCFTTTRPDIVQQLIVRKGAWEVNQGCRAA